MSDATVHVVENPEPNVARAAAEHARAQADILANDLAQQEIEAVIAQQQIEANLENSRRITRAAVELADHLAAELEGSDGLG